MGISLLSKRGNKGHTYISCLFSRTNAFDCFPLNAVTTFPTACFLDKWTNVDKMDKFGQIWANLDKFGQIWANLDKFGQIWTSVDKCGQIRKKRYKTQIRLNRAKFFYKSFTEKLERVKVKSPEMDLTILSCHMAARLTEWQSVSPNVSPNVSVSLNVSIFPALSA